MTPAADRAIRQVLLAGQGSSLAEPSLSAARAIAEALQAELRALFVEDPNLLRMAALPFTREVGAASGAVRPIDRVDMERALRLQADRLRRTLAQVAPVRIERGVFAEHLLGAMTQSVAAVVLAPPPGSHTIHGMHTRARTVRHLVVVDRDIPGGERTLALAVHMTRSAGMLCVAVAADTDRQFQSAQQRVRAQLPAGAGAVSFVRVPTDGLVQIVRAVAQTRSVPLLLSSAALDITPSRLTQLLEKLRSPLVLVQ